MKFDSWTRMAQFFVFLSALAGGLWLFQGYGEELRLSSSIAGASQHPMTTVNDLFVPGTEADLLLSAAPVSGEEATLIRRETESWLRLKSGRADYELTVTDLRSESTTAILTFPLQLQAQDQNWTMKLDRVDSGLAFQTTDDMIELAVPWSAKSTARGRRSHGSVAVPSKSLIEEAELVGLADDGQALIWQLDSTEGAFRTIRFATRRSDGLLLRMASLLAAPTSHLRLDLRLLQESFAEESKSPEEGEQRLSYSDVVDDDDD